MIKLNEEQKKYIDEYSNGEININGIKYYFKLIPSLSKGIELVVENLAKLVDIKSAHYEMVTINGLSYYLCEDVAGKDEFFTAYDLGFFEYGLYDIWHELELRYPDKSEFLMQEIVKIYIFDILLLNNDRNYGNYGFKFVNGKIEDVYIYDNGDVFSNDQETLTSKFEFGDQLNSKVNLDFKEGLKENIEDLDYFLQTSSSEYYDLFKRMYDKLTPEVIKGELDKIEINYQSKIDMLNIYKENYALIKELLHKRGLK